MTTIVYSKKHHAIACDSRMCVGSMIGDEKCKKYVEREGVLFFFAGAVADIETLMVMYFNPEGAVDKLDVSAFIVDGGKVYATEFANKKLSILPLTYDWAIGSGMYWAMAALDFGCDPKEAVKYAKKKDSATGGRIHVFKL